MPRNCETNLTRSAPVAPALALRVFRASPCRRTSFLQRHSADEKDGILSSAYLPFRVQALLQARRRRKSHGFIFASNASWRSGRCCGLGGVERLGSRPICLAKARLAFRGI